MLNNATVTMVVLDSHLYLCVIKFIHSIIQIHNETTIFLNKINICYMQTCLLDTDLVKKRKEAEFFFLKEGAL